MADCSYGGFAPIAPTAYRSHGGSLLRRIAPTADLFEVRRDSMPSNRLLHRGGKPMRRAAVLHREPRCQLPQTLVRGRPRPGAMWTASSRPAHSRERRHALGLGSREVDAARTYV